MAGLLSTVGTLMRLASNVSEDGAAKGALKTLQDKEIKLLRADGSMMKLVGNYIVEPIAVVSNNLKDVDELDHILGLHMDLFTSYYMQVYDILTQQFGLGLNTAIDTLATDNGGLERMLVKGLRMSTESNDPTDVIDYLGDMIRSANSGITKLSIESTHTGDEIDDAFSMSHATTEGRNAADVAHHTSAKYGAATQLEAMNKVKGTNLGEQATHKEKTARERYRISQLEAGKLEVQDAHEKKKRNKLKNIKQENRVYHLNRDIARVATTLHEGTKDLLIPNAIQRTLNITAEVTMPKPGTDGQFYTRTYQIPVTVKLAVIFTSTENLVNMVTSENDEYSFSSRLDSYKAGAISMADFFMATDLIKRYKKHKLKDKDGLMAINKSRELSSNSKIISNGFAGFEKYYNMYILSPEDKAAVSKSVGSNILSSSGKDKFLSRSAGISVTVVDPDYERISLQIKDIRGKTDLSFKKAIKKDKNDSDYGEVIKALMANKAPAF